MRCIRTRNLAQTASFVVAALLTGAVAAEEPASRTPEVSLEAPQEPKSLLDEIVVTGTRSDRRLAETPLALGSVHEATIDEVRPGHPSEIMERIPGVHINPTSGEGHMAAIRQPISTKPLYLYLEDGVPVRSTGFFNHNALYEVNLPQARRVEVIRGPGTALHGSDAIGGVVNSLTRPPPEGAEADASVEAGGDGWRRVLLSAGTQLGNHAFRIDTNLTASDGWRDFTEYERQSYGLRIDNDLGGQVTLRTILSISEIDQTRAAASIGAGLFADHPSFNPDDISFREVTAVRVSTELAMPLGSGTLSLTPYYRHNEMSLMPDWQFSFDPQVWESENDSLGLLAKVEFELPESSLRVVTGADVDYSPGERSEYQIFNTTGLGCGFGATPTSRCLKPDSDGVYREYERGVTQYDYDVTYLALSPYVQLEFQPAEELELTAGLRYDHASFDYDTKLGPVQTGTHRRPGNQTVTFRHSSVKLGAAYAFSDRLSAWTSYRHGFRIPSERALFRQGASENTVGLEPIKADSVDVGLRGQWSERVRFDLVAYQMRLRDDVLSIRTSHSLSTENAGETLHRGVELGVSAGIREDLSIELAYSVAQHTYGDWRSLDGNTMAGAPRDLANTTLRYSPDSLGGGALEAEWVHVGKYWMDPENDHRYAGHDLLNLRASLHTRSGLEVYARLMNALDTGYAQRSTFNAFRGEQLNPGRPRTFFAGVRVRWAP